MNTEKQFLVALHVKSPDQALEEAYNILTQQGAHGIFLSNKGINVGSGRQDRPNLFTLASEIKQQFPDHFIGINPLDRSTQEAIQQLPKELDGLWVDDGGVKENETGAFLIPDLIEPIAKIKKRYFGSIAFKCQEQPRNIRLVAECAGKHFGTIITSGTEIGKSPTLERMYALRQVVGDTIRLGIAGALTAENVSNFLPFTDVFIVASSLNKDGNPYKYDTAKVEAFRQKIDSFGRRQGREDEEGGY